MYHDWNTHVIDQDVDDDDRLMLCDAWEDFTGEPILEGDVLQEAEHIEVRAMELVKSISVETESHTHVHTRRRSTTWWERMTASPGTDNPSALARWRPPTVVDEPTGATSTSHTHRLRLNGRIVGKVNVGVVSQVEAIQRALVDGKQIEVEYKNGDLLVQPAPNC